MNIKLEAPQRENHTRNAVSEACPTCQELNHLDYSDKDPSSPSLLSFQAHLEFFRLCCYYKVPCQERKHIVRDLLNLF